MKTLAILCICALLAGCNTPPQLPPEIIPVIDRDKAYIPYPACPDPTKIVVRRLPIADIDATTSDTRVTDLYISTVAILKSDLAAALKELEGYAAAHEKAKQAEAEIKKDKTSK